MPQRPSNSRLIDNGTSFPSRLPSTTPSVRHRLTSFYASYFLLPLPLLASHKSQQRHKNITKREQNKDITKLQDLASSRMSNVQPRVMSDKRQHFSRILFHNSWPVSWSFCFACSLRVELFLGLGSPQSYSIFFLVFVFVRSPRVEFLWELGLHLLFPFDSSLVR